MKNTGSPEDSWVYRSVMSVARPSWLESPGDEEMVRISVGTYMRGRTEALGTLDGHGGFQRVRLKSFPLTLLNTCMVTVLNGQFCCVSQICK